MKNLKIVVVALLAATGLAGCKKECATHTDKNHDGTCEVCGKTGLTVNHTDENKDHKCDVCEQKISEHNDENGDHKCDYCGSEISSHTDANPADHACDICGAKISTCVDNNHDAHCDICGKDGMTVHHIDTNFDDKCDVCGTTIVITEVDLDISEAKTSYNKFEEFSTEGVVLTGTCSDGTEKDIQYTIKEENLPDMEELGVQTVVLSYKANGQDNTISYDIEVIFWTDSDLEIMDADSLFSECNYLPFFKGMFVESKLTPEEEIESWNVCRPNSDEDFLEEYWDVINNFYREISTDNGLTMFELTEIPVEDESFAEYYGFVEGTTRVFKLVPYINDPKYGEERAYIVDEYIVFGLDADDNFKLYNRLVSSCVDGVFAGTDDLYYAYWASKMDGLANELFSYISLIPEFYFSEFAPKYIPSLETEDGYAMLTSLNTAYPFASQLDNIDMGVDAEVINGTTEEEQEYRNKLVTAGYTVDAENENVYTFENKYFGKMTITVRPYSDNYFTQTLEFEKELSFKDYDTKQTVKTDKGFGVRYLYEAPEGYASLVDPIIDQFLDQYKTILGEGELYHTYHSLGCNVGVIFVEGTPEEPAVRSNVETLVTTNLPEGYEVTSNEPLKEEGVEVGTEIIVSNGTYNVTIDIYDADEEGDVEVDIVVEEIEEE